MLTVGHKSARLEFAKKYMSWAEQWRQVVFSDEKKFNLDGPDGIRSYWHDLRSKNDVLMSRNFGGGSVMVWGGFNFNGTLPIEFISTKMNSAAYIQMLQGNLLANAGDLVGATWVFQQDNAAIHRSRATMKWFEDSAVAVLEWPSRSPDMNPIENLWGILARRVYANGRQFDCVGALKQKIEEEWSNLDGNILQNLINSMPKRIFEVILNKGGHTKY